jgi:hypothetical protein
MVGGAYPTGLIASLLSREESSLRPDDVVTYNDILMRRDYAESLEEAQRLTWYVSDTASAHRIAFGAETYPLVTMGNGLCPCCSAARGQLHEPLCEREQCPVCRQQVMSCDCDFLPDNAVGGPPAKVN